MNSDPMSRFALGGEQLDPDLRREILALGPAAVPPLLRFLEDEQLQMEDSPGGGWPPIHAVGLLADLKATEAIGPMLRLLCESDWDAIIHDRIVVRIHELGPELVEPALCLADYGDPAALPGHSRQGRDRRRASRHLLRPGEGGRSRPAHLRSPVHALRHRGDLRGDEKPGRNDPCPCGSGKKYKRCCMT